MSPFDLSTRARRAAELAEHKSLDGVEATLDEIERKRAELCKCGHARHQHNGPFACDVEACACERFEQ